MKRGLLIVAALLLFCASLVAVSSGKFADFLNRRNMKHYFAESLSGDNPAINVEKRIQYEHYRDRLTASGYLQKRNFTLQYIPVLSKESKKFWKLVIKRFPENNHMILRGYEPGTVDELVVWDTACRLVEWEEVISEYNVPDYQLRLSIDPEK